MFKVCSFTLLGSSLHVSLSVFNLLLFQKFILFYLLNVFIFSVSNNID